MLDINLIKSNPDYVKEALAKKGWEVDFTDLLGKVEKRVELLKKIENVKAEANKLSSSVPMVKKEGGDIQAIFAKVKQLNADIKEDEVTLKELENDFASNKIDFYFNDYRDVEYDMDVYTTISPFEEKLVIASKIGKKLSINSIILSNLPSSL